MDRNESTVRHLVSVVTDPANTSILYKAIGVVVGAAICSWFFFASPAKQKNFPGWIPIEIAVTAHLVSAGGIGRWILTVLRRARGSLFGITGKHQTLYDLPGAERFFAQPSHTLDPDPLGWAIAQRVFGVEDRPDFRDAFLSFNRAMATAAERMFTNDAAATKALQRGDVEGHAARLVSFAARADDQELWERAANVRVIADEPSGNSAAEANLLSLLRDFGMCVALPPMYGHDFLARGGADLLADFWRFDNELFPLLMVGVPKWAPLATMREGLAARRRLISRLIDLYRRVDQHVRGAPVDGGVDVSDVSAMVLERHRIYCARGLAVEGRGMIDMGLLWGQNANTQMLLFWFVLYIYATPGLVDELRRETEPCVPVENGKIPSESINIQGLARDCPLLKSTLFETYRLANDPTTIRYVAKPVVVDDGPLKQSLRPGTWVSAPHAVIQKDPAMFPEPSKFVPDRFLETDPETGKRVARYGRMKPWGAGVGKCKGRTFAERELLTIAAAVLQLWDIEPVGGAWKIPSMRPGTGAVCPTSDVRVVLKRRAAL